MIYESRCNYMEKHPEFIQEYDFLTFSYTYFLCKSENNKLKEKFLIFILSLKKSISIFRIHMFSKFMNLFESGNNYSIEETNKYFEALDFIVNKSNIGFNFANDEKNSRFMIPFARSIQYLTNFFIGRMTAIEYAELKIEIEKLKENDPKNDNTVKFIINDKFLIKKINY